MHLFLTGKIGIGKSTIINTWLEENPEIKYKGFKSISDPKNTKNVHLVKANDPTPNFTKENLAGIKRDHNAPLGFKDVFNSIGCEILGDNNCHVIIMDELGIMENDADKFINCVLDLLDQDTPVLGVIKPKNTAFLDAVRAKENVSVLSVSEDNRDDIQWFMKEISRILEK